VEREDGQATGGRSAARALKRFASDPN